jgi:putative ABC transport system permease protein
VLRNYLAAAIRNLSRNRLYAAINIIGLAVAFAAAGLIGLYLRDELTFERWMPGHEGIYRISAAQRGKPTPGVVPSDVAGWLRHEFPQIEEVTRLLPQGVTVSRGDREFKELVQWADPNVFKVLPFRVVAGDASGAALQAPDSVVLTQRAARLHFGNANPIGEILTFDRKYPMRVTAVIEDLPSNTHLNIKILAASHAPFSMAAQQDAMVMKHFGQKLWSFSTYFRLKPGHSIETLRAALPDFLDRRAPPVPGLVGKVSDSVTLTVGPIADIHLSVRSMAAPNAERNAATDLLFAMGIVGVLIVAIASINFINLMTARASRRAVEVGVRKALGAGKGHLMSQFLGEAFIYVSLAMVLALALIEIALPSFNAFLDRTISMSYWQDGRFALGIVGATLLVGLLSGVYPSFVLSMFRPASVLKGGPVGASGSTVVRQVLVVAQFAVLIALIIISVVFHRQSEFAMRQALAEGGDQILMLESRCSPALKHELRSVPGVKGVACAMQIPFQGIGPGAGMLREGKRGSAVRYTSIDVGLFELYGLEPVAGRFFDERKASDRMPTQWPSPRAEAIVVNEALVRALGFDSPKAAVGQIVQWTHLITLTSQFTPMHDAEIIGVVPDFILSVNDPILPVALYYDPAMFASMSVKIDAAHIPRTLAEMGNVWKRVGDPAPFRPAFLDQVMEFRYQSLVRQTTLATSFAGVALFIACLGLFGLSAFTTERRTKEIGVRKAMGASSGDVMRLLVLQFTKPVVWAILLAWPLGYYVSRKWLETFVFRIDLAWWMFVGAAGAAMVVALLTVSAHSFLVSRETPLNALRHE